MKIFCDGSLFAGLSNEEIFDDLDEEALAHWAELAADFAEECEWEVERDAPSCVSTISLPVGIPLRLNYRFLKTKGYMKLESVTRLPDKSMLLQEGGLAAPVEWTAAELDEFIAESVQDVFPAAINIATFLKTLKKACKDEFRYMKDHLEDLSVLTETELQLSMVMTFPAWSEESVETDEALRQLPTAKANEAAGTQGLCRAEALASIGGVVDHGREAAGILQGFAETQPCFYLYAEALVDGEASVQGMFKRDWALPNLFYMAPMLAEFDMEDLAADEQLEFDMTPFRRRVIVPLAGSWDSVFGCGSLPWWAAGHPVDLADESAVNAMNYALSYENGFLEDTEGLVCASESRILWRGATFVINSLYGRGSDVRLYM